MGNSAFGIIVIIFIFWGLAEFIARKNSEMD
jgi:hypothetical protein